jgi:hypothetical protein
MSRIILLLIILPIAGFTQKKVKTELRSIEGSVETYLPARGITYSVVKIKTSNGFEMARFPSRQGKELIAQFPIGTPLKLTTKTRVPKIEIPAKGTFYWLGVMFADSIVSIQSTTHQFTCNWLLDSEKKHFFSNRKLLLDETVKSIASIDGRVSILTNSNILIFEGWYFTSNKKFKKIKPGTIISNFGNEFPYEEGEQLVTEGMSRVTGTINSFLFKQNSICIAFSLQTEGELIRLNFPAEFATQLMEIEKRKQQVTAYYDPYVIDKQMLIYPSLQALICGKDTVRIEKDFYGDADGKHEYRDASQQGTITNLTFDKKGRILSIILNNQMLIESNEKIQYQLASILKKGSTIKVDGQERVKKEGEVYQNNYSVMIPKKIMANGVEFIVEK